MIGRLFRKLSIGTANDAFVEDVKAALADGILTHEERDWICDQFEKRGADERWLKVAPELWLSAVRGALRGHMTAEQAKESLAEIHRYLRLTNQQAAEGDALLNDALSREARRNRIQLIREGKVPPPVISNVPIRLSERPIVAVPGVALEERVVRREYVGGSRGTSIRVMKGVSFRVGGSRGHSVPIHDIVDLAQGTFIVTTKRVVFSGNVAGWSDSLKNIVGIEPLKDGIRYTVSNRQKPRMVRFSGSEGIEEVAAAFEFVLNNFDEE